MKNLLCYGDCLTIMQEMALSSVDLIYLDPPFNSNQEYNAIYKDETGRPLPDQIEAFCDQWTLDPETERAIRNMPILLREAGIDDDVAQFWRMWTNALRNTNPALLAYLSYMTQRLLPMKGILRPSGSIYLHCDPTASHYIKVMMDAIFGHKNFKNEIIWNYSGWNRRLDKHFNRRHDTILFYAKGPKQRFNSYAEPWKSEEEYIKTRKQKVHEDADGRKYVLSDAGGGKRIARYLDEAMVYGKPVSTVWNIDKVNNSSSENTGYATQKPLALLDRIIRASSDEGDVVLDPFCGCATTIEAAHRLGRKWIGIDIAIHAVKRVAKARLEDRLRLLEGRDFEIRGWPRTIEGAIDLFQRDPYQFQKWAVEQIDGFVTSRRTGDGGIDGRLYFGLPNKPDLSSMAIEVKGGKNVGINVVRDLRGVLERDDAEMVGLIILHDIGPRKRANFVREMAAAGDMEVLGRPYPRMQLLTVQEILDGKWFNTPGAVGRSSGQAMIPSDG